MIWPGSIFYVYLHEDAIVNLTRKLWESQKLVYGCHHWVGWPWIVSARVSQHLKLVRDWINKPKLAWLSVFVYTLQYFNCIICQYIINIHCRGVLINYEKNEDFYLVMQTLVQRPLRLPNQVVPVYQGVGQHVVYHLILAEYYWNSGQGHRGSLSKL